MKLLTVELDIELTPCLKSGSFELFVVFSRSEPLCQWIILQNFKNIKIKIKKETKEFLFQYRYCKPDLLGIGYGGWGSRLGSRS